MNTVDLSRNQQLIGVWELDSADASLELAPGSLMMFLSSGELRYAAPAADGSLQVALLTYRLEGTTLVTSQPSAPREERTGFHLRSPDRLELEYAGGRALFRRVA